MKRENEREETGKRKEVFLPPSLHRLDGREGKEWERLCVVAC